MRSQRKKVDPTLPNENGPPCFNQWIESPIRLNSGNFTPIDDSPISNVLLVFIQADGISLLLIEDRFSSVFLRAKISGSH